MMPASSALIPVTIVTGFLGAGKTTLLRNLVQRRQTRRLALLINEFGEVTIDGDLIRAGTADRQQVHVHDFSHGLIAYGDDTQFVPAMLALAARRAKLDHVLIETSGLASPTAVMERLQSPELASHFILDATLAVVDTPLLLTDGFSQGQQDTSADGAIAGMFHAQLEYADVVVLNKIDTLDDAQLLEAEQRVRTRAPQVRFLELAYHAQLDIRLALGLRLHQPTLHRHAHTYTPVRMPGTDTGVLADQSRLNGHAHSGLGAHHHGLATHRHFHEQDPGWLSFTLRSRLPQSAEKLKHAIAEVARREPVLRTKGFVRLIGDRQRQLVQGVRTRVAIQADAAPGGEPSISELVFIGYHPSRSNVAALLTQLTETHWK